jgi:translation initiation factor IF-1
MAKERDDILVVGEVVEVFPNAMFKIQIDEQHHVLAVPAGRLRLSNIRLVAGDKVRVALSPYDLTRGRITWRLNEGRSPR